MLTGLSDGNLSSGPTNPASNCFVRMVENVHGGRWAIVTINHLIPTLKHGGGSVMVWSCFSWNGLGPLIIIDGNLNAKKYTELLSEVKETMGQLYGKLDKLLFQQDNAP